MAWIATPIVAVLISFISLFILQNVFQQKTYIPVEYQITAMAELRTGRRGSRWTPWWTYGRRPIRRPLSFRRLYPSGWALSACEINVVMAATETIGRW